MSLLVSLWNCNPFGLLTLINIEFNCLCHLIIKNITFSNLLATISRLSVLDGACAMGELQAGLFRLGLLNGLETKNLQSESCEKVQETHDHKQVGSRP